ncbi:ferredoxin [Parahaliea sp. F7430]|uniref:Ferredoxin n=1 Tax=Sediminihaliea albiluteola TaxID=2758564 RepID=A0A7W2YKT3_9GAMM|nr:ferredoxin [Sediminihaliea albiluteola]MBA6413688.1 ferredoxin [Sediminihaliea albiluteola]
MGKYQVKVDMLLCQGHGVCADECPEVFEVVDTGTGYPKVKVKQARPSESLRSKVQDAVNFCPNQTIRIIELD